MQSSNLLHSQSHSHSFIIHWFIQFSVLRHPFCCAIQRHLFTQIIILILDEFSINDDLYRKVNVEYKIVLYFNWLYQFHTSNVFHIKKRRRKNIFFWNQLKSVQAWLVSSLGTSRYAKSDWCSLLADNK